MAEKYLKFSNKADSVSRIALEKLGYSTKRNDPNTIGKFGSGSKFAPIAAIRSGLNWYFTGVDNSGPYVMHYAVQQEDGIDCIVYDYGDYIKPSSFTVDAGVLSWIDPFQIYREALANAMDAAETRDDWNVSIVHEDEIAYEPGWFSCYITASSSMLDVHFNFDKYFSVNKVPSYETVNPSTQNKTLYLDKIDDSFRVYSHGVLVFKSHECTSVFDYDMNHIQLNEERTVKNLWDLESDIAKSMSRINSSSVIRRFIDIGMSDEHTRYFEFAKINVAYFSYNQQSVVWSETFLEMYGNDCVIYDAMAKNSGADHYISLKGYNPVFVESAALYSILKKCGIKEYLDIADDTFKYDPDFNIDSYPKLKKAIKIVCQFEPRFDQIVSDKKIGIYQSNESSLGMTLNPSKPIEERVIIIEKRHLEDPIESIVATLIHEFDHYTTGIGDGNAESRAFRNLADVRIGKLMVRNYNQMTPVVSGGMVSFRMEDASEWLSSSDFTPKFKIERVVTLGKIMLSLGSNVFVINGDAEFDGAKITDPVTGAIAFSDGETPKLTIPSLSNVITMEKIYG